MANFMTVRNFEKAQKKNIYHYCTNAQRLIPLEFFQSKEIPGQILDVPQSAVGFTAPLPAH
jgi:hypothetical protein